LPDIKVVTATHKRYRMAEDPMYIPIHCGACDKESIGYAGDDTGEHISERNPYYCELTAVYWAWKNIEADYIGISHYRRYFTASSRTSYLLKGKWNSILSEREAEHLFSDTDIIVPNKRWYLIETNEGHYGHSSKYRSNELPLMGHIIEERCATEYVNAFQTVLNRRWAHMFNMYIMKKDCFDAFCEWMFDLLFVFEDRLDRSEYTENENRAYIDELMLDIWLTANGMEYKECNAMFMEKQNWFKKIVAMVKRKFEKQTEKK
jgi:hypothetical protein